MELLLIEETSAISPRLLGAPKPKSVIRDRRLGWSTLSSLALPSIELGSSCSRNMLKRADKLGMSRLVRKSSDAGSAAAIFSSGFGSTGFLLRIHLLVPDFFSPGERGAAGGGAEKACSASSFVARPSGAAFFLRNRFIVALHKLATIVLRRRGDAVSFAMVCWRLGKTYQQSFVCDEVRS